MADQSQRQACYNDPTLILLTEEDYFKALYASLTNAAASFPTEAPSYGTSDWILAIYNAICRPLEKGSAFICNPQARLVWNDQVRGKEWRDTDFGVIQVFDRLSPSSWLPAKPSRLLYLVEIKALDKTEDWRLGRSDAVMLQSLKSHISQVCEQAYYAFRHYGVAALFAFLIIGNNFALFEFNMPPDLDTYIPPRKVDPSEELAKLLSNPRKRRRLDSIQGPSPTMLKPTVIYPFQNIVDWNLHAFSGFFRKALDMTTAPHVQSRQPSWFLVPPGEHKPSDTSVELANAQIDAAADEVSGKALQTAIAEAEKHDPTPDPPKNQDKIFKAPTWLENAASALQPKRNTPRSSRANSVCSYKEDSDEKPLDSEPGPSSSSSSLVDALGNLRTDDGAPPPPASSRPSSPSKRSAHLKHTNADPSSSAPAAEEVLVPKRKTRSAKESDHMLGLLTRRGQAEEQDKAAKGKDTKGKGRAT